MKSYQFCSLRLNALDVTRISGESGFVIEHLHTRHIFVWLDSVTRRRSSISSPFVTINQNAKICRCQEIPSREGIVVIGNIAAGKRKYLPREKIPIGMGVLTFVVK